MESKFKPTLNLIIFGLALFNLFCYSPMNKVLAQEDVEFGSIEFNLADQSDDISVKIISPQNNERIFGQGEDMPFIAVGSTIEILSGSLTTEHKGNLIGLSAGDAIVVQPTYISVVKGLVTINAAGESITLREGDSFDFMLKSRVND